ncbi:hypothetical protein [Fulvivirga ligni]|uniref:hypothetical protein n=1 Tax=Fulvivirga ligni TaxID=2904246 RepID=UPI001F218485|nr:hypothetical protein [Fulvivirga ligni]UII21663.1 hypothetical protein LVD16_00220 [Fulvivirga ligni]
MSRLQNTCPDWEIRKRKKKKLLKATKLNKTVAKTITDGSWQSWLLKKLKWLVLTWLVLTIIQIVIISNFHINDFIAHPQHEHFDCEQLLRGVNCAIVQAGHCWWYWAFFIIDIFWALFLLLCIGIWAKDNNNCPLLLVTKSKTPAAYIFVAAASLAYLTDLMEGVMYSFFIYVPWIIYIIDAKTIAYIICLGFLLYGLFKNPLLQRPKIYPRFLITCILSILCIGIIYGLIMLIPQGRTIVIDLFFLPWNIPILFLLLTFLAILVSHYPVYFDIWLYDNNRCIDLKMDEKDKILGMGIIYYAPKNDHKSYPDYDDNRVKIMRRSLGILLYIAVINIMISVGAHIYGIVVNAIGISAILFGLVIAWYFYLGRRYTSWRKELAEESLDNHTAESIVKEIRGHVIIFNVVYIIAFLLPVIACGLGLWFALHPVTYWLVLAALPWQILGYIQFKIVRTYFKYIYYSEWLKNRNPAMFNATVLSVFKRFNPKTSKADPTRPPKWYCLGLLSDNISYLKLMRFGGITSLMVLLIANFWFDLTTVLNPMNIILCYLIVFYYFLTILFKHILFYYRNQPVPFSNFYRYGMLIVVLAIMAVATYFGTRGNNLHTLETAPIRNEMSSSDFFRDIQNHPDTSFFLVGSYGGGLKANLWNMLLLNDIQENAPQFFDRTLALSGVSGGALGIGNFVVALKEHPHDINDKARQIGESNVLSNELTYLLGRDWIREYLPWSEGGDRAFKSMAYHARNAGMGKFNEVSYLDYWKDFYASRQRQGLRFPALILNSTMVGGKHGVASSVKFPEEAFPGAIRTEKLPHNSLKGLTFYSAVSTTNRFPIVSPSAKIEGMGSFLDGGYFENSGLLSLISLYNYIQDHEDSLDLNPIFVNIINDQDFYIRSKLETWGIEVKELEDSDEFGSIISTVTSIDKLPDYVGNEIEARGHRLIKVLMPHMLSYNLVREQLKGEIKNPLGLMNKIAEHNEQIIQALKDYDGYCYEEWGIVQPPLARLLSIPAVRYEEAMVKCHPAVRDSLEKIYQHL